MSEIVEQTPLAGRPPRLRRKGYLVLAILFGLGGAAQIFRWHASFGFPFVLVEAEFFLPAAVFAANYYGSGFFPGRLFRVVGLIASILAVGVWGLFTAGSEMLSNMMSEVTSVRRYESVLTEYWGSQSKLVSHFPRSIPPEAANVRFSFSPAFLQGGAHMQLRYALPPAEIEKLYDHFSQIKTKSFFGGEMNVHMNMDGGMPTTFFYTGDEPDEVFPGDYEIMTFDPVTAPEDSWNHGHSHGVAISKTRHEIVYWAETW